MQQLIDALGPREIAQSHAAKIAQRCLRWKSLANEIRDDAGRRSWPPCATPDDGATIDGAAEVVVVAARRRLREGRSALSADARGRRGSMTDCCNCSAACKPVARIVEHRMRTIPDHLHSRSDALRRPCGRARRDMLARAPSDQDAARTWCASMSVKERRARRRWRLRPGRADDPVGRPGGPADSCTRYGMRRCEMDVRWTLRLAGFDTDSLPPPLSASLKSLLLIGLRHVPLERHTAARQSPRRPLSSRSRRGSTPYRNPSLRRTRCRPRSRAEHGAAARSR